MADEDIYELAVNNYPNQVQNFEFMGYNLQLTLLWNAVGLSWSFDLYDNIQGEYIVQGEGLSTVKANSLPNCILIRLFTHNVKAKSITHFVN